jgi:hypothetical protein
VEVAPLEFSLRGTHGSRRSRYDLRP